MGSLLFSAVIPDPAIIASTDRFVVIDKPPGMLSVPGKGEHKQDCAVSRVRARFPDATGPMVVHRLDMETSGLMLVALDPGAQRELSGQFERRTVEKSYTALLDGDVYADEGEINLPMRADIERRPYQIIDHVHGRQAITRFRVLAREVDRTRVEFSPVTGRCHQLRVHAAAPRTLHENGGLACPILGDALYGDPASAPRLMLHATRLSFLDLGTNARIEFASAAPF